MNLPLIVQGFASGADSPISSLSKCLVAARDPLGEGERAYTQIFEERSRSDAQASSNRIKSGAPVRALEGIAISVKDLFDVEGTVTRAGSLAEPDKVAATTDAAAIRRLREAGAVITGKTNMTEFAYSGMGVNPHFGTPLNPFDRTSRRIPGGSSSGAAVAVSDGMALASLATDTGGSIRIPAAFCGLVGWKPTAKRVSSEGALPLSRSLDSVGPIASDVASCIAINAVLAQEAMRPKLASRSLRGIRLAAPSSLLSDMDVSVSAAFGDAIRWLARCGVEIIETSLPEVTEIPDTGAGPVIVAAEAHAWHRQNLAEHAALYDPRVRSRLERGASISACEYIDALRCRIARIEMVTRKMHGFDGWLMPTVPIIAPRLSECQEDEQFFRLNKLVLRNPSIVNFLDGCAISLPCHSPGDAPVGVTLVGCHGTDHALLELAWSVEQTLALR